MVNVLVICLYRSELVWTCLNKYRPFGGGSGAEGNLFKLGRPACSSGSNHMIVGDC